MALVSKIVKTVEIPGEDHTATIRKLSHVQLKMARKARQSEGVGFMREMGGELLKALRESNPDTDELKNKMKKIQDAQESDISNYDRDTLLLFGVVSWSYDVAPIGPADENGKVRSIGLDDLDESTAKFLAEEVFNFCRPETKDEVKNA
jgi:hypothetical protein